jgi:hypothetical protein
MLYADLFPNKELFIKLVYRVKEYDYYFLLKKDCTRMYSFTSIQTCRAASIWSSRRHGRRPPLHVLVCNQGIHVQVLQDGGSIWSDLFKSTK